MNLSDDIFGRSIIKNTVGDKDIYTISSSATISVNTGTSIDSVYRIIHSQQPSNFGNNVSLALQTQTRNFDRAVDMYIDNSFPVKTRLTLLSLHNNAIQLNLVNRATYIYQVLTWLLSVYAYYDEYISLISAMIDPQEIINTPWDFSRLIIPNVNIPGALAILD
jgi:hypothetical protein